MPFETVEINGVKRGLIDYEAKVYSKYVTFKNRKLKPQDSWSIDRELFEKVLLPENYLIIITDKEKDTVYELYANEITEGDSYFYGEPEHGPQVYKFISSWRKVDNFI